ncbi:MAG TPA: hypothetical protein VM452_00540 [Caulifigura sp.]|jgi:hypothetical protein|nr:hypothetical protein [Caulifigura sp.]
MTIRAILAVMLFLGWTSPASAQVQIEVTTARDEALKLAAKLPTVDTDSVNCPPFDAEFRMNLDEGAYVTQIQYRRPGRMVAIMRDAADGAPVAMYRNRTACVFDAATPQFLIHPDYKFCFELAPGKDGQINCGARIGFGKDTPRRLHIDLAGILQLPEGKLRDLDSTDEVIRLEQRRNGGKREEVELRLDREPPVCVLRSWMKETVQPGVILTLTIHAPEGLPLFEIPDPARVAEVLPVRDTTLDPTDDWSILGAATRMKRIAGMMTSVHTQVAVRQPGIRGAFKVPGFHEPDWSAVQKNKTELGSRLAAALGLSPLVDPDMAPLSPQMAADDLEQVVK